MFQKKKNSQLRNEMKTNIKQDIFFDLTDYFRPWTKQRIWHTVPNNMIPNDMVSFRDWLYKPNVCEDHLMHTAYPKSLMRKSCRKN